MALRCRAGHYILPNELFDEILVTRIAESLHLFCVSSTFSPWDFYCISTLSSVCHLFREITTSIVMKAFKVPRPENRGSIFPAVRETLDSIRWLGPAMARPIEDHARFLELDPSQYSSTPIIHSYLHYAVTTSSINRIPDISTNFIAVIVKPTLDLLAANYRICTSIRPRPMASLLRSVLEDEIDIIRYSLSTLNDSFFLGDKLEELEAARKANDAEATQSIMAHVHVVLLDIEEAVNGYDAIPLSSMYPFTPIWSSDRLPGAKMSIKRLSRLSDMDAYDIHARATSLLEKWTPKVPELESTSSLCVHNSSDP